MAKDTKERILEAALEISKMNRAREAGVNDKDDCEAGKINIVLTKSISRFARNTVDLLATVRRLKELSIEVRFEKEHINSLSGDGEVMLSILASFAQEESTSLSKNIKWRIQKKYEEVLIPQKQVGPHFLAVQQPPHEAGL